MNRRILIQDDSGKNSRQALLEQGKILPFSKGGPHLYGRNANKIYTSSALEPFGDVNDYQKMINDLKKASAEKHDHTCLMCGVKQKQGLTYKLEDIFDLPTEVEASSLVDASAFYEESGGKIEKKYYVVPYCNACVGYRAVDHINVYGDNVAYPLFLTGQNILEPYDVVNLQRRKRSPVTLHKFGTSLHHFGSSSKILEDSPLNDFVEIGSKEKLEWFYNEMKRWLGELPEEEFKDLINLDHRASRVGLQDFYNKKMVYESTLLFGVENWDCKTPFKDFITVDNLQLFYFHPAEYRKQENMVIAYDEGFKWELCSGDKEYEEYVNPIKEKYEDAYSRSIEEQKG